MHFHSLPKKEKASHSAPVDTYMCKGLIGGYVKDYHRRILFGPEFPATRYITEFDRRLRQTRDNEHVKDPARRASVIRWVVDHIA